MRHVARWSIVAHGLLATATAQQEAWRVSGVAKHESLGGAFAIVDDRNGDGVPDLLIAAPGYDSLMSEGRVLLVSGSDLSELLEIQAPSDGPVGSAVADVADVGDVDGDGVGDFLYGCPTKDLVRICSGATGATLLQASPAVASSSFGSCVVGLGDVDGDGVPDFAIGTPYQQVGPSNTGRVVIASGATGAMLHSFDGSHPEAYLGDRNGLANLGDLDGDGIADLARLDFERVGTLEYSVVRIASGATGVDFITVKFDQPGPRRFRLRSIASLGDLNGDGLPDFAVGGMPNDPTVNLGRIFMRSGATGAGLRVVDVGDKPAWLIVGATGDYDGDLVPDLVASTSNVNTSGVRIAIVTLISGATGLALATLTGELNEQYGRAFAAGIDSDGDGQLDVVVGAQGAIRNQQYVGEATATNWQSSQTIAQINGEATDSRFGDELALIDDFDGDGTNDFVATQWGTPPLATDALRIHSGRDGSLLLEHLIPVRPDGELVAVPDQDGDGHDDVAFGEDVTGANPAVEVRSTATGLLLQRFLGSADSGFGHALDVGLQPGGVAHLAIGAPYSWFGTPGGGEIQVIDLATGALVFQRGGNPPQEWLGYDVAFLGDVDGDGIGDWAAGAPRNSAKTHLVGRVLILSGTGARLKAIVGTWAFDQFGTSIVGVGDLDGDGLGDFAAAAPNTSSFAAGEVRVFGSNGWALLDTVGGTGPSDEFGTLLESLPDLNGDGVREWAAFAKKPLRFELRSGDSAGLMARIPTVSDRARYATPQPWHVGSANGDLHPDVLVADIEADGGRSQAWLIALDDLLLELAPPVAASGATVTSSTRGGAPGRPVALEFVSFGGAPVGAIVDVATLDVFGTRSVSDTIPPGLSGLSAEFRAWAIGFGGGLVTSPVQTLTFQ